MKFKVLLIKLLSYSSDFNLIEIFFAMLKIVEIMFKYSI